MTGHPAPHRTLRALLLVGGLAAGASAAAVPRTPEAKKLAADLLGRIERVYYSLHETDVQGFEATFTTQFRGQPAGLLTVQWERARGGLRTALPAGGGLDERGGAAFANMMRMVLGEALLGSLRAERIEPGSAARGAVKAYAVQDGEWWQVDLTDHLGAVAMDIQEYSLRVAKNLGLINARYAYRSGSSYTYAIHGQEARGRRYVAAITNHQRRPGEALIVYRYTLGYTHRQGVAFPRFVALESAQGAEVIRFRATLKDVTFRKGAAVAEEPGRRVETLADVAVPCSEEAEELAQELIARLNRAAYSLLRTEAQGFEAAYTVTVNGERVGRYVGTWRRGAQGVSGRLEGAGDEESRKMLAAFASKALGELVGDLPCEPKTYAVRRGEEYVFDCQTLPDGTKTKRLSLSADLCRLRRWMLFDDGRQFETTYVRQRAGQTLYLRSVEDRFPKTGSGARTQFTYTRRTAVTFPRRIRAQMLQENGAAGATIVFELATAAFPEGEEQPAERPAPAGLAPGLDPRRTSADPDYGTTKTDPVLIYVARESVPTTGTRDERFNALMRLLAEDATGYVERLRDGRGRPFTVDVQKVESLPSGHVLFPVRMTDAEGTTRVLYLRSEVVDTEAEAARARARRLAPKGMYFPAEGGAAPRERPAEPAEKAAPASRTSADPAYGTTKEKPIPAAVSRESLKPGVTLTRKMIFLLMLAPTQDYVKALRDAQGRPFTQEFGELTPLPDGLIWPHKLTDADGKVVTIYFRSQICDTKAEADRVNARRLAPKGMHFAD